MKNVTRECSSSLKFTLVANSIGTSVEYSLLSFAVCDEPASFFIVFYGELYRDVLGVFGSDPLGVLAPLVDYEPEVFFFF